MVGDHPCVKEGVPLTFDWDYTQKKDINIEEYEQLLQQRKRTRARIRHNHHHHHHRNREEFKLNAITRKFILIQFFQVPQYEILAAEYEVSKNHPKKEKQKEDHPILCRINPQKNRT